GIVDLGTFGGTYSQASAVNPRGQVVGYAYTQDNAEPRAFLWSAKDGIIDLGTLGGRGGSALAVSPGGQVVGGISMPGCCSEHAFSWTAAGGMVDLERSAEAGPR